VQRQIRRMGIGLVIAFLLLFAQLNYVQFFAAGDIASNRANPRALIREYSIKRGDILSLNGKKLATSVATKDRLKYRRTYPMGELFGHITGYYSINYGPSRIESSYNDHLLGDSGVVSIQDIEDRFTESEEQGNRVRLTIDTRLQEAARAALGEERGAVVALDPTSGEVKALWSNPSFDPEPLASHSSKEQKQYWGSLDPTSSTGPLVNIATTRGYPPGSTFKVVTAAAALERKTELVDKSYPVLRQLDLPHTNNDLPNFGGSSCGGPLPQLLRVSCNTGFAQMGLDLGTDALRGEAEDFGFGSRPPIDLPPGSGRSRFPSTDGWLRDDPQLAQSAIGQNDVVATPLQMALVAAGVANKGVIMKPHAMAEVRDDEGEVVRRFSAGEWRRATSAETAAALTEMMIGVVDGGTARGMALPGVKVAGKTGTAQTTGRNAHAWIVGFAPADAPKIAVAVIVESQPGVSEATGGRVAAPIARAVIQAALSAP
jgi:penicillin-binding protein A